MDIKDIRNQIDNVDQELVKLIERRMNLSKEVANYKISNSMPVYDATRERAIINKIANSTSDDLAKYMQVLYSTIFNISRSYQNCIIYNDTQIAKDIENAIKNTKETFPLSPMVACQGVEGAYSQAACDKLFSCPNITYFKEFEGVFKAVESGLCDYGILPIENSTAGSVNEVYDLMKQYNFFIARSIQLRVDHNLVAKKGVKLENIKEIYSHEQAIKQCSEYLHRLGVKTNVCENTAVAAKLIAESDRNDVAALCSSECTSVYNLDILDDKIMNNENNYTRFICISKKLEIYPGANKTSIMFALPHKPGSLYNVMSELSVLGINITKLESRPIPGKNFEFMFYFDIETDVYSKDIIKILGELNENLNQFVYLGSYSELF